MKGLQTVKLLVASRKSRDGFDYFHISHLVNEEMVIYSEVSLVDHTIVWGVDNLEDYKMDFKSSFYNEKRYVEYTDNIMGEVINA